MTIDHTTTPIGRQIAVADRLALHTFIAEKARETEIEVGFGWVGTAEAPSTYQQLRGAYAHSQATGDPLPVSNEHCESTIYVLRSDNMAFRYWHDVSHVRQGLSFRLEDELELAMWHLSQIEQVGYDESSSVYRLFEFDLVGQIFLMGLIGRFPLDQGAFVGVCNQQGMLGGLLHEIRRVS
ncbi:MAG: hypothetical protein Q7T56_19660 [Nocardioidaceae bacterium]|nr:hypothetical protein [Nocardioidaceae bacterium]